MAKDGNVGSTGVYHVNTQLSDAQHDHNKIAPCGMIKVFELNWIELQLNFLL